LHHGNKHLHLSSPQTKQSQPCRDEHRTYYTRTGAATLRLQHNLRIISRDWHIRVFQRESEWIRAFNKTLRRVHVFRNQLATLSNQLWALYDKHKEDPASVEATDWDNIARGSERKVLYIMRRFPRHFWREGVPYPNLIALLKWQTANIPEDEDERENATKNAEGKYECPHCNKTYLHLKHLKRHLLRREFNSRYSTSQRLTMYRHGRATLFVPSLQGHVQ
jgi:hypothetical protein